MKVTDREILSIIIAALERGQHLRMTVNGRSMSPFIYDGDIVELEPVSLPKNGDIVLARFSEERYVIHRIIRIEGERFFLRGDAQLYFEGPLTFNTIFGKVTTSFHNKQKRIHTQGKWYFAGLIWVHIHKIAFYARIVIHLPRRCASRLFRIIMGIGYREYVLRKRENRLPGYVKKA
jgi:hypothetical protein